MSEALKFLQDNTLHYVATVGLDGRPRVRPFQSVYVKAGRIYYCTNNAKAVYKELQKQPDVQINALEPQTMSWLRVSARAVFTEDAEIKKEIFAAYPSLKNIYQEPANPIFAIFYLANPQAVLYTFKEPPRELAV
ncbi:MAG: pyridoxamine 5'-phosphate oxidase family protein [Candidatus Margulisbacteria bacterium]|jgi:uncharacterized pyridoxamine 5'-phosphate oxidase family protein|nr:pyridoxamine 5'-phosphate oxidase family protein [Candidatus Margulisiibacteriota bacterium]